MNLSTLSLVEHAQLCISERFHNIDLTSFLLSFLIIKVYEFSKTRQL